MWRIGGDSAPLPISASPLVRCPSLRGSLIMTPTPSTVGFRVVEDEGGLAKERLDPSASLA